MPSVRITFEVENQTVAERALNKIAEAGGRVESIRTVSERAGDSLDRLGGRSQNLLRQVGDLGRAFTEGRGGIALWDVALTAARTPALAFVAVAGAIAFAVSAASASLLTHVDVIQKVQQASGLEVQAAGQLAGAVKLTGSTTDALTAALGRMSQEIDSGGAGLARLGISLRDNEGRLKTEGALLLEVQQRLAGVTDSATRNALSKQILGRSYAELNDFLGKSNEEMKKLLETSERLNPVSAEQVRKAEALKQAQAEASEAWQGLTNKIADHALPAQVRYNEELTKFLDLLRRVADWSPPQWMKNVGQGIAQAAPGASWMMAAMGQRDWLPEPPFGMSFYLGDEPIKGPAAEARRAQRWSSLSAPETRLAAQAEHELPPLSAGLVVAPSPAELALRTAEIKKAEQATLNSIALREASARAALGRMEISERQFTDKQIGFAKDVLAAELKAINARAAQLDATGPGRENPAVKEKLVELEMQRAAARQKADLAAANGTAKLEQLEEGYLRQVSEGYAAQFDHVDKLRQANIAAERAHALERIQITGTAEEAFIAQADAEASARADALFTMLGETEAYRAREEEIYRNRDLKIAKFQQDRQQAELEAFVQWQEQMRGVASDGASGIEDAYAKLFRDIDTAVQVGALSFAEGEAGKANAARDRTLTLSALEEQRIQKAAALYALDVTNFDSAANKELRLAAAKINEERGLRERLIADRIALNVKALANIDETARAELAIAAGTVNGVLAERQRLIDDLESLNTAHERFFQQGLDGWAAQSRAAGDYGSAFSAELAIALTRGRDFYSNLTGLAEGFAEIAERTLADVFFDPTKVKIEDLKNSLRRLLAEFAASQTTSGIGRMIAELFDRGQTGAAALTQASTRTAGAVGSLGDAAQAAAIALNNAAAANGGTPATLSTVPRAGTGPTTGSNLFSPPTGSFSWLGAAGSWLDSVFGTGVNIAGSVTEVGSSLISVGAEAGEAAGLFAGLGDSVSGFAGSLGNAIPIIGAAVGILTTILSDAPDWSKAVQSAVWVAGAALAGPTAGISLVVAGVVNGLLSMFGGDSGPSAEWLSFHTRLGETLEKESAAAKKLTDAMAGSKTLDEMAQAIVDFRHDIEAAGVGGFVKSTEGLGALVVPDIPGATGTLHEGGIAQNFGPWRDAMNAAIRTVLTTFATDFAAQATTLAQQFLPPELMQGFLQNTLAPVVDFITNAQQNGATADDIKAKTSFVTDALTGVGQLRAFTALLANDTETLTQQAVAATAAQRTMADEAVAKARAALEAAADPQAQLDAIKQIVAAEQGRFALVKTLLSQVESNIASILSSFGAAWAGRMTQLSAHALEQGDVSVAVGYVNTLKQTAEASNSASLKLWAVRTALAAIITLTPGAVAAGGAGTDPAAIWPGLINAASPFLQQLIDLHQEAKDAGDLAAASSLLQEGAAAAQALATAALAGIDQWRQEAVKSVEDWAQAAIKASRDAADVLDTFAASWRSIATEVGVLALEAGDPTKLQALHASMLGVASSAESLAVRLWALHAAAQAATAAIPAGVSSGLLDSPSAVTGAAVAGIQGPLSAINREFLDAKAAGDFRLAFDLLDQAAGIARSFAEAARSGVEQFRRKEIDRLTEAGRLAQEANDRQLEGLNEQRQAIEKNLQASREWKRVTESIDQFIRQTTANAGPADLWGTLLIAQQRYQEALTAFDAKNTPEAASRAQQLAQETVTALGDVFTNRSDPQFIKLFNEVMKGLDGVRDVAAGLVTPEEQAAQSLKSVDDQIKKLTDDNKAIAKNTADQIKAVNDAADREIREINAGLGSVLSTISQEQGAILKEFGPAIDDAAKLTVGAIEALRDGRLKEINDRAKEQADIVRAQLATTLGAIAGAEGETLASLIRGQLDVYNSIAGGDSPMVFTARKAAETVDKLEDIRLILERILTGEPMQQAASGMPFVPRDMPVFVHEGEAILDREDADLYRRGRTQSRGGAMTGWARPTPRDAAPRRDAGGTVTITNYFTVTGGDGEKVARDIERRIARSARTGLIRAATRKRPS